MEPLHVSISHTLKCLRKCAMSKGHVWQILACFAIKLVASTQLQEISDTLVRFLKVIVLCCFLLMLYKLKNKIHAYKIN